MSNTEKYNTTVSFKITEKENIELDKITSLLGYNKSEYIRMILKKSIKNNSGKNLKKKQHPLVKLLKDMNQEKNHWLALYLIGKYPGHFHTPDKILFISELQAISPNTFSDEKIKMFGMFGQVDEYEFYLSFLGKVERNFADRFSPFLQKLNIPKEIIEQSIKKIFDDNGLLQEFKAVKSDTIFEKELNNRSFKFNNDIL